MPDWLVQVVVQYPIVVVVGLVAWFANRRIEDTYARSQAREDRVHADAVETMRKTYERAADMQAAETARLSKEFKDELRKLTKVVAELNERLNS